MKMGRIRAQKKAFVNVSLLTPVTTFSSINFESILKIIKELILAAILAVANDGRCQIT